jgi:D-arabinan exo alpha-(1,3)/(1,5)-arabinofuranosidase (non-reducing end)
MMRKSIVISLLFMLVSAGYCDDLLRRLMQPIDSERHRASTAAPDGSDYDFWELDAGETAVIFDCKGPGVITHIWCTFLDSNYSGALVVRMWWDGEENPSVDVPLLDFFGRGAGATGALKSLPFSSGPDPGLGHNCWLPMPFNKSARIEVENQGDDTTRLYYYVDYEKPKKLPRKNYRFHAQWHYVPLTPGIELGTLGYVDYLYLGTNLDPFANYVIVDATGKGNYIGSFLYMQNRVNLDVANWYGEGDDMIWIDDDEKPRLLGTGQEDYFATAFGPNSYYSDLFNGILQPGGENYYGRVTWYRFHIADAIPFKKHLRVSLEHGHANRRSDAYRSVAFWYQKEPHAPMPPLPNLADRAWPPLLTVTQPGGWTEGESLTQPMGTIGAATHIENAYLPDMWLSGGQQVVLDATGAGCSLDIVFEIAEEADYQLQLIMTGSPDYGRVQFVFDSTPVGGIYDGYATNLIRRPIQLLNNIPLEVGTHVLHLYVNGKNNYSNGYKLGLDCFLLMKME